MPREKKRKITHKRKSAQSKLSKTPKKEGEKKTKKIEKDEEEKKKKSSKKDLPQISSTEKPVDTEDDLDGSEVILEIQETNHDIRSLYDLDDEDPIDMTTMEQKTGKKKWFILVSLFLILFGAIAYFGYTIFSKDFGSNDNGTMELSIQMEDKVASGDLVTIEVQYQNRKNVTITSAELEIFYPDGFYFKNADIDSEKGLGRIFNLGEIQSGAGGVVEITGQLVGVKGDDKEVSALLTYMPQNFSNNFQVNVRQSTRITSSIIDLSVEVPAQIQSGQEIEYTVNFTNTATLPMENVKIQVEYPDGFEYTGADIEPRGSNNDWRLESLTPGKTESLTIRGILSGSSGDTKEFNFQLGVVEIDNTFTVQIETTSLVVIINPEADLTIEAPNIDSPKEDVEFTVKLKNTSEAELRKVKVRIDFDGDLFKEEKYIFDEIDKIVPFEEKELKYKTTLKKFNVGDGKKLSARVYISQVKVEGNDVSLPAESSIELKLRNDLNVTAEGRYFDDDLTKIGDGPLPPSVGEDTTYIIRWNINNGNNAVNDFAMKTTLPSDVIWTNNASKGISYDSSTRQVSYSKEKLEIDARKVLEFELTIAPTLDDINSLMVLTGETNVSGVDAFTGEVMSQQIDRITTDLPNDEGARGKGVVEGS